MLVSRNQQKYAFFYQDSIRFFPNTSSKYDLPDNFTFQTANFTNKDDELLVGSHEMIMRIKTDNQKINFQIKTKSGKIIQIASNQKYIIFLQNKLALFINDSQKILQFYHQCSHDECKENQKEKGPYDCQKIDKYTLIEVSSNQNFLALGFEDPYESSTVLIIEEELQESENCITATKFIQLDFENENQLKVYFVDDDKYILTFSHDSGVTNMRLWNYKEKKTISRTMLDGQIKSIAKITDLLIATINSQYIIQIWDLQVLLKQQNSSSKSKITSCIFSINNNIISGNEDGIIQIWDTKRGIKIGKDMQHHTTSVTSLTTYKDKENKEILISGDFMGYINIWDLKKQKFLNSVYIISPIKSLDIIVDASKDIFQLISHSQYYHYLQLWSQDYKSYSLFCKSKDQHVKYEKEIIQQSDIISAIKFFKNKQNSPKKFSKIFHENCSAFAIGQYTNNLYLAEYPTQQNKQNLIFINVYREEFQSKDQSQEILKSIGTIQLTFDKDENLEVTSIIKEFNSQNLLAVTQQNVFIIKIQKLTVEKTFNYKNIGKILDIQLDEDLLFICGNRVEITNIRTGKQIPSIIKTTQQQGDQQKLIEGEVEEVEQFCKLVYYRLKNILFVGTISGKLIEYELYCNSYVHYQYTNQIIYLQIHTQQVSTGQQDILVSAGKDSFIHFWPLNNQDLKSLKNIESKQIVLGEQIINRLWYFDKENFLICQNQTGYYLADYNNLTYYQIADYNPLLLSDYSYSKQAFYQFAYEKPNSQNQILTKTMVLQEAFKNYYQEKNQYQAEIMLIDHEKNQVITSDDDAQIIFWNIDDDQFQQIQAFDTNEPQQVQINISKQLQKLICGCFYDYSFQFSLISLEDHQKKIIQLKSQELQNHKLIQLQMLNPSLILILTDSKNFNINIYSIDEEEIQQQIKDHSGKSIGLAVLQTQKQKEEFMIYGEFNQLTYYIKLDNNNKFAQRFRFGQAIKKFTCEFANTENSKFTSKHGINLLKIFQQNNHYD